jgi:hypothetical protein
MKTSLIALAAAGALFAAPASAIELINNLQVANGVDLSGLPAGVNGNRLGGFGSDLFYDSKSNTWFGMTDRGPGGGLLSYSPRIQQFSLSTDATTGAISNFNLVKTVVFKQADGTTPFNGLNPGLLNGDASMLGASLDSEGLVVRSNGNFLVSDEYGPSVYEFDASGTFLRAFTTPDNLIPRTATAEDYVSGRPTIVNGRQDNRGYEGLTLSNDGTKAFAVLQDPLVNEGAQNDGRRSRNVRIVEFDVASGTSTKQYIYQLEDRADINARLPSDTFSATNQGRSIGVSGITQLPDGTFLVLERDNRGLSVDSTTLLGPVGTKRIFRIDLTGAEDFTSVSLGNTSGLPAGFDPVGKSLFLDIQAELVKAGLIIPEKIEGMAFGPWLADGSLTLLVITDNDFSVTQNTSGDQFDVCTSTDGLSRAEVALDAPCTGGLSSIPTNIYAFKLSAAEAKALGFTAPVPEPASWAMMIGGFALAGGAMRRRARVSFTAA